MNFFLELPLPAVVVAPIRRDPRAVDLDMVEWHPPIQVRPVSQPEALRDA
jgi:hypothetical protein